MRRSRRTTFRCRSRVTIALPDSPVRRLPAMTGPQGRRSSHGPARAIHRLVLWAGVLSTVGAMSTLEQSAPNHAESECGFAAADLTARDGELGRNSTNTPMPVASLPDNWSAFNGHEVLPWNISRAEAAATLRRARNLRARGQATVSIEAVGRYRLSTFNTLILNTKRS